MSQKLPETFEIWIVKCANFLPPAVDMYRYDDQDITFIQKKIQNICVMLLKKLVRKVELTEGLACFRYLM